MHPVHLVDTFQRKRVPLETLVPGKVGMYVCGPTTYTAAHIGHAYSAISFDTIRRSLEFLGYEVRYVRNVTDVDDKIIEKAHQTGEDPIAMSAHYAQEYNATMALFGISPPTVEPKVSQHIEEIISLAERLIAAGKAYHVQGDVYFSVETFPAYGGLSKMSLDDLHEAARTHHNDKKRAGHDFALWKAAKEGEPAWPSPWGKGRPGWHIECSAMTHKHLGETFDIHAGGRDLLFPHHENEIAQSQGAFGPNTFARYWMHNGFLNFEGEKMSRSLGNVMNAVEVAKTVGGEAFRLFCAKHHYASPINFETFRGQDGAVRYFSLEAADKELAYFYTTLAKLEAFLAQGGDGGEGAVYKEAEALVPAAIAALGDDFNAPQVLAALYTATAAANKLLDEAKGHDKQQRRRTLARFSTDLRKVGKSIGLLEQAPSEYLKDRRARLVKRLGLDEAKVGELVAQRVAARQNKDFAAADALRKQLAELHVELHDGAGGTEWTVVEG